MAHKDRLIHIATNPNKIIFNLLSNAIRFTKPNGIILVSIGENSEFIIKDNGKGISEIDLPNIFERFYQSGDNTEGGSGIGLSLVKKNDGIA